MDPQHIAGRVPSRNKGDRTGRRRASSRPDDASCSRGGHDWRRSSGRALCLEFQEDREEPLIGSLDITVPKWGLTIRGCLWHRKGEKEWVSFPGREWVDRKTGEIHYANLIDLDRPVLDRFRVAALQAVHAIVERGAP